MTKVLHVTRTWLSGVANNISRVVEHYYPQEYNFNWVPTTLQRDDEISFNYRVSEADIVHWHNWIDHTIIYKTRDIKKHFVHYHSEPMNIDILPPDKLKDKMPYVKQLVVGQYHAALAAYKSCTPVRNALWIPSDWKDLDEMLYMNGRTNELKIAFSPTPGDGNIWQNKDPNRHIRLVDRLKKRLAGEGVKLELKLIHNMQYKHCIWNKSLCDIVLDECVTPSFHLSALEGLALGRMTVCWVDDKVKEILQQVTGSNTNPFHGCYIGWLEDYLMDVLTRGPDYIKEQGQLANEWYKKYWSPESIAREYHQIYSS